MRLDHGTKRHYNPPDLLLIFRHIQPPYTIPLFFTTPNLDTLHTLSHTNTMTSDYSDIIHLPRHISTKHPAMNLSDRAAQFSPYAALVGHKDIITQKERHAAAKTDLDCEISIVPDKNS